MSLKRKSLGWRKEGYEVSDSPLGIHPFLCTSSSSLSCFCSCSSSSLYEVSDSPTGHPASTHFSAPAPASRTFTHRPTPLSTPTHPFSALSTQSCLLLACVFFVQILVSQSDQKGRKRYQYFRLSNVKVGMISQFCVCRLTYNFIIGLHI